MLVVFGGVDKTADDNDGGVTDRLSDELTSFSMKTAANNRKQEE